MERASARKALTAAAVAAAMSLAATGGAVAQTGGPGMGHGMMGGYGSGYGMGPGMMGGYGMGPGMMGGYGGDAGAALNLTDEQRSKWRKVDEPVRRKQWELMGKMQDEQTRLADLYRADKRDDAALSKTYGSILDLRKQMFDNMLAAHKQLDGVLTKEQREQVRRGGYGMWFY